MLLEDSSRLQPSRANHLDRLRRLRVDVTGTVIPRVQRIVKLVEELARARRVLNAYGVVTS